MKYMYDIGDSVFHLSNDCYGTVKTRWSNGRDGYRYEVLEKGHLWSVPEVALENRKPRKKKSSTIRA